MIYLSSFKLSDRSIKNPNIYPYNVFHRKDIDPFIFAPITVLYGNNGSGKSTILNIIANKLMLTGKEYATSNSFGIVDYCGNFHQSVNLVMERMNLAMYLGDSLKTADLSRVRISCMKSKKYSEDRFVLMVWNMII